jgi:hypothetical protein
MPFFMEEFFLDSTLPVDEFNLSAIDPFGRENRILYSFIYFSNKMYLQSILSFYLPLLSQID